MNVYVCKVFHMPSKHNHVHMTSQGNMLCSSQMNKSIIPAHQLVHSGPYEILNKPHVNSQINVSACVWCLLVSISTMVWMCAWDHRCDHSFCPRALASSMVFRTSAQPSGPSVNLTGLSILSEADRKTLQHPRDNEHCIFPPL